MNESSGEWNQFSTALVEKEGCFVVAPFHRVVPANIGYPIVGCRTVRFDFFMVFPFVDDNYFRVATNVDNIV